MEYLIAGILFGIFTYLIYAMNESSKKNNMKHIHDFGLNGDNSKDFDFPKLNDSLGIETLGGRMTKLIDKGTLLPATVSQVFSTAEDNQPAVSINVFQGESEFVKDNESLGLFELGDIPDAPRGVPQIEVAFHIDVNAILTVSSMNKETGAFQSIKVSGVGAEDIQQNIKTKAKVNLNKICEGKNLKEHKTYKHSHVDELTKWAELFEKGFISKEDFEKKKKELM